MKRAEAEKLLGGHAAGILTEAERRALFEAALEHQGLFDALMDEEALRELLADPAARVQVLAALAPSAAAPPRLVPFWRRPGVIGAAAGILVATTAGLAILRSPEAQPPAAKVAPAPAPATAPAPAQATNPAPEAQAIAAPPPKAARRTVGIEAPRTLDTPAAPAPAPPAPAQVAGAVAPREEARAQAAEVKQLEVRDQVSRKAEAAGMNRAALLEARDSGSAPAPRVAAKAAAPAPQAAAPVWTLDTLPDGSTRVTVSAPRAAHVVLLRRGSSGVEVIRPAAGPEPWLFQLRLAPGDVLDLYVLSGPAADAARLPETGPVDGFRARIHPPAKK
ncbi:hypothetical protein [Geothrix edaphica]|uniref:Uncharacterized protein n=1 Tax=Geothrix edaphica TaxID=2927976 RepID=A0ABQ5PUW2_9BACT|nr:hypothetical protein [Geothrix edaphica]GLH65959.1 hypothetical protein GETHED_03230 [Geothrix edaphica]